MTEMQQNKNICIDSLSGKIARSCDFDFPLSRFVLKHKKSSILFSPHGMTRSFFTGDSKLYYNPEEYKKIKRGERVVRLINRLDSLNSRVFEETKIYSANQNDFFHLYLRRKYAGFRKHAINLVQNSPQKVSLVKIWNLSIVGAIIFGMFTMTMIYRYLGQNVSAKIQEDQVVKQEQLMRVGDGKIMGVSDEKGTDVEIDAKYITQLLDVEDISQSEFEKKISEMVKGYPIEKMVPLIAKYDRTVAAFLIGIARQESSWGVHVPVYQGQDCYNYWGWRGKNAVGSGGHTCFNSPEEAVSTVAKRLEFLVSNKKLNTPEKMIIWKCGDCSWDKKENMQRWINSVSMYFHKLNTE